MVRDTMYKLMNFNLAIEQGHSITGCYFFDVTFMTFRLQEIWKGE